MTKFFNNTSRSYRQTPGGVLEVYMTGGSDVFFWVDNLHARYFFGSRDLSRIFLGLKKIRVFFWVLSPSELFVLGFRCDQWIRKIFIRTFFQQRVFHVLVFFWVGNFDARYFFGSKISGLCIFLGLQYEAPLDPPRHVYFEYPPGHQTQVMTSLRLSKHQSVSSQPVLLRTTLTQMIIIH